MKTDQLRSYIARALQVPPHVAAAKAFGVSRRAVSAQMRLRTDLRSRTFAPDTPPPLRRWLLSDFLSQHLTNGADLKLYLTNVLQHRFDLLGSSWQRVSYEDEAGGILDVHYPRPVAPQIDADGEWLRTIVSASNLTESKRIWTLVSPDHEPIDWRRDFKSGWLWSPTLHFTQIEVGPAVGADIKWPWELARLQHLPVVANAIGSEQDEHVEAQSGDGHNTSSESRLAQEIRSQILDFIATNPPRFGVNWACPMDVGIRIANILLAVDLAQARGHHWDQDFIAIVARSALEHGRHIVGHLEWSDQPRSNHYLANLGGLVFCGAYLLSDHPDHQEIDREARSWVAFAAQQISVEALAQIHPDGGSTEGSCNYHRLSGEILIFATAMLKRLTENDPSLFTSPTPLATRVRPPFSPLSAWQESPPVPLEQSSVNRLSKMAEALFIWQKPNGHFPQIGDTDSGRFFCLEPALAADGTLDPLDQRTTASAFAALFGLREKERATVATRKATNTDTQEFGSTTAALTRALMNGHPFNAGPEQISRSSQWNNHEELSAVRERLNALPSSHLRFTRLSMPSFLVGNITPICLPNFGLFGWRTEQSYITMRVVSHCEGDHHGHTHDDNLHLEVFHNGQDVVADPGSYLYTPFPHLREQWRRAAAHFVPRPTGHAEAVRTAGLFGLRHLASARCLHFSERGVAATLDGSGWQVTRCVMLSDAGIEVIDGCNSGPLAPDLSTSSDVLVSTGYGKLSHRSVRQQ